MRGNVEDGDRHASPTAGLLCPSCRVDLVMSERQGIEIDYCPKCRGVWLDRGELDKILERSAADLTPPAAVSPPPAPRPEPRPEYPQGYDRGGSGYGHRDDYRHKHRRKSFLEELFD